MAHIYRTSLASASSSSRTRNSFTASAFYLGRWRIPAYISTVIFNALIVAVDVSPFFFPVDADSFNFAPVIFGAVTIFGVLSWWLTPKEKWLRQEQIEQALRVAEGLEGPVHGYH